MIYTLKLDQTALQVLGEALALAPMPMRATHPVLTAIQQQVSAQEDSAQPAANKPRKPRAPKRAPELDAAVPA
jgi:hypothetical protein